MTPPRPLGPLDPGAARLLRMLAGAAAAPPGAPSAEARRQALRDLAALAGEPPDAEVDAEGLAFTPPGADAPIALRLYRPRGAAAACALTVYLHGGGWVAGDLDTHDGVCRALARAGGGLVLALDYRRPPEHRFPAAIEDAAAAVLWVRANTAALGADPARIALAGDSAGGNIAAATTHWLLQRGASPIRLLMLLCPILELEPLHASRERFAQGYFLDPAQMAADLAMYLDDPAAAADPLASPLRIPDLAGFPPTRLHLAEFDPFRDEGLAFAERLAAADVDAQAVTHAGMIHYFYALGRAIPNARPILGAIGAALNGMETSP